MGDEEKKKKAKKGMGLIPFFNDMSVYKGIKLLAWQRKQKTGALVLEIVGNHYQSLMGQPLNILLAEEFHKQLSEASKKQKTSGVADFIEYCCSKYWEKAVDSLKPSIRRG